MRKQPTTRRLMREAMEGPGEPCDINEAAVSLFLSQPSGSRLDVAARLLSLLGQLCSAEAIGAAVLGFLHKYDDCISPEMLREMRRQLSPDWSWSHEETEARARFFEAQTKALAAECDRLRIQLSHAVDPKVRS